MIRSDANHPLTIWLTIIGLACAFLALFAVPLQAATTIFLEVDTTVDDADLQACTVTPDDCSLRGVVERANADPSNLYVITLPAGTYQLGRAPDATPDDNADGDLDVLGTMEIQGAGAETTVIQAGTGAVNGIDRLFHVADSGATLALRDVTLRYGRGEGNGGALYNTGTLELQDVLLVENTAVGQSAVGGKGGAIYNLGSLTLLDVVVEGNATTNEGIGTQQDGNLCGGGIYNEGGTLAVTGTLITGNASIYSGGGIYSAGGTVILSTTQVLTNSAEGAAGFYIAAGVTELYSSTVDYNAAGDFGCGGLKNLGDLTLVDSTVSHNTAQSSGGGICNEGTLTVTGSILFDNANRFSGGGIYNYGGSVSIMTSSVMSNSVTDMGGGLYNTSGGVASILSCAIYENNSNNGGGGAVNYFGSTMDIFNTTIANNFATGSSSGGGLLNAGALNLMSSTIAGNTATASGGGIRAALMGTLNISNTIVAGNTSPSAAGYDCSGTAITSQGYNLVGSGTGCPVGTHDQATSDAKLDSLADNGGDTPTLALLSDSPAIEQIPDGANGCTANASVDQRGAVRAGGTNRGGTACDIGAYEYVSNQQPNAVALHSFGARRGLSPAWFVLAALLGCAAAALGCLVVSSVLRSFRMHTQKTHLIIIVNLLVTALALFVLITPVHATEIPWGSRDNIATIFDGIGDIDVADMDGDGDLDVVGVAAVEHDVAWWENTASDGSAWTRHTIYADFNGAHSVQAADIDGDGDLDLLTSAVERDDITWWENSNGDASAWPPTASSGISTARGMPMPRTSMAMATWTSWAPRPMGIIAVIASTGSKTRTRMAMALLGHPMKSKTTSTGRVM